jgi:hypothetical protein
VARDATRGKEERSIVVRLAAVALTTLTIDIANPEDIRGKLLQAQALYDEKRKQLDQLRVELEWLYRLIESLAVMVDRPVSGAQLLPLAPARNAGSDTTGKRDAPAQEAAIEALRRAGRSIGPAALFRFMQEAGMEGPPNSNALGVALWTAAKAGLIVKTDDGLYAIPLPAWCGDVPAGLEDAEEGLGVWTPAAGL